jgi:biopolymer transport protein ExbD
MFGSPQSPLTDATPELNTTPLIDVMLVLLMMFMLTVPIATHVVHLDTAANHHARIELPPTARVDIDFDGVIYWNDQPIPMSAVAEHSRALHALSENAELQVYPAARVRYDFVAKVLAAAQLNGVRRLRLIGNNRFL